MEHMQPQFKRFTLRKSKYSIELLFYSSKMIMHILCRIQVVKVG